MKKLNVHISLFDMTILSRIHRIVGNKSADTQTPAEDPNVIQIKADDKEAVHASVDGVSTADEKPTEDAQAGVRKIEAVTLTWGKGSVFTVLILYDHCSHQHAKSK